jgi:hypothetical protein
VGLQKEKTFSKENFRLDINDTQHWLHDTDWFLRLVGAFSHDRCWQ